MRRGLTKIKINENERDQFTSRENYAAEIAMVEMSVKECKRAC